MRGSTRRGDGGQRQTFVVVEFFEDGEGTLARLAHSGFATEEMREVHIQRWQTTLANLERTVFS